MCKVARAREWGTPQHATAGTRLPPRCPSLWRAGQACVAAVLTTNAVHSGVHTWNSPVWPLLPLLLNRLTELLALSFGHTYLAVTSPPSACFSAGYAGAPPFPTCVCSKEAPSCKPSGVCLRAPGVRLALSSRASVLVPCRVQSAECRVQMQTNTGPLVLAPCCRAGTLMMHYSCDCLAYLRGPRPSSRATPPCCQSVWQLATASLRWPTAGAAPETACLVPSRHVIPSLVCL